MSVPLLAYSNSNITIKVGSITRERGSRVMIRVNTSSSNTTIKDSKITRKIHNNNTSSNNIPDNNNRGEIQI